jgi:hypothetical protein
MIRHQASQQPSSRARSEPGHGGCGEPGQSAPVTTPGDVVAEEPRRRPGRRCRATDRSGTSPPGRRARCPGPLPTGAPDIWLNRSARACRPPPVRMTVTGTSPSILRTGCVVSQVCRRHELMPAWGDQMRHGLSVVGAPGKAEGQVTAQDASSEGGKSAEPQHPAPSRGEAGTRHRGTNGARLGRARRRSWPWPRSPRAALTTPHASS